MLVRALTAALRADFELRGKLSEQTECNLKRVERDFGDRRATQLTAEQIDTYVSERLADGSKPASINRVTQLLKQSFTLAVKRGHLTRVPDVRRLKEDNARKGFLSPADFAKLLAEIPDDGLRDFCQWGYATGQRKGESSRLRWDMLDGDTLRIPGTITKNEKGRNLPLSTELREIIERRRAVRAVTVGGHAQLCSYIFHRKGKQIGRLNKAWATACTAAGVTAAALRRCTTICGAVVREILFRPVTVCKFRNW
jgi:integrase